MVDSESRAVSQLVVTGAWMGAVLGATLGGVLGAAAGGGWGAGLAAVFGAGVGAFAGLQTGAATALLIGLLGHGREHPWLSGSVGAVLPGAVAAVLVPGSGPGWPVTAATCAAVLGAGAAVFGWRLTPPEGLEFGPATAGRVGSGRRSRLMRASGAGALIAGVGGAVAGLVIGVQVNPPTAPFAAVELGLPAAAIGLLAGALIGCFR